MPPGYPPGYAPPGGGASVAWEDTSLNLFSRWWTTIREVTFNPRVFFAAAAYNENPWPAISFAMTTAAIVGLVLGVLLGLLYMLIGGLGALSLGALGGSSGGSGGAGAAGSAIFGFMSVLGIGMAILYPLMFVCGALFAPWIYGGIHHLTLTLLKGATRSYTHTVRVVGYSYASYFWFLIPGVGAFAGMASMLISLITGLDETHRCGTGNATLAVFLIPGACCVCGCAMQVMLGVAGGMSHGP